VPGALTQEGVAPKREIGVREIKQRYCKGDHPHADSTQGNNLKRDEARVNMQPEQ
jgi:hypothetical protein